LHRSAFATETELKLIANAAIIGESKDQKDIKPCRNRVQYIIKESKKKF
jgi:hypothetical protein